MDEKLVEKACIAAYETWTVPGAWVGLSEHDQTEWRVAMRAAIAAVMSHLCKHGRPEEECDPCRYGMNMRDTQHSWQGEL